MNIHPTTKIGRYFSWSEVTTSENRDALIRAVGGHVGNCGWQLAVQRIAEAVMSRGAGKPSVTLDDVDGLVEHVLTLRDAAERAASSAEVVGVDGRWGNP